MILTSPGTRHPIYGTVKSISGRIRIAPDRVIIYSLNIQERYTD